MAATFQIELQRTGGQSYGFSIVGGHPSPVLISQIKPGSLAEQAGLVVGDRVVAMNGTDVAGMSQFKVVGQVKQAKESLTLVMSKSSSAITESVAASVSTPETKRRAGDAMRKKIRAELGQADPATATATAQPQPLTTVG